MTVVDIQFLITHKQSRAGVIPFTIYNDEMYFLLACDRRSRDLCDFGGGCKMGESLLTTAIREFQEESNGIFEQHYSPQVFGESVPVIGKNMTIIFLPIDPSWIDRAAGDFSKKFNDEISTVRWVSLRTFKEIVYNPGNTRLWIRLRSFLMDNIDIERLCLILACAFI